MIELKGINKKFEGIAALTDMSGEIREGSVFGLVGTNGAGKSTCLRLISRVLRPYTGEVLVDVSVVIEHICHFDRKRLLGHKLCTGIAALVTVGIGAWFQMDLGGFDTFLRIPRKWNLRQSAAAHGAGWL